MKYEEIVEIWKKGDNKAMNSFFIKFICNSIQIGEIKIKINQDYKIRKRNLKDILEQR